MTFRSFFMAGFECATGWNEKHEWIDQIVATQHDLQLDGDYRRLKELGIDTIREGVRWPLVDICGKIDLGSLKPFVKAAREHDMEVIWDLFHYGYPADLNPFSDEFVKRFADYSFEVARYIGARTDGRCLFTPVNEPSYLAWAGAEAARFAPHLTGQAFEFKIWLAKASIAATHAIRAACDGARIVNVDPVCRVATPRDHPELADASDFFNERAVFESLDMISGKLLPELGGSPDQLDIVGINYYWTNQWELEQVGVPLAHDDERLWPLRDLIHGVWRRYGAEMILSETSHVGDQRANWLRYVVSEVESVLDDGIPLRGVCLYPVLGMPEWHAQEEWTHMGLWDLCSEGDSLTRMTHDPSISALKDGQERLGNLALTPAKRAVGSKRGL